MTIKLTLAQWASRRTPQYDEETRNGWISAFMGTLEVARAGGVPAGGPEAMATGDEGVFEKRRGGPGGDESDDSMDDSSIDGRTDDAKVEDGMDVISPVLGRGSVDVKDIADNSARDDDNMDIDDGSDTDPRKEWSDGEDDVDDLGKWTQVREWKERAAVGEADDSMDMDDRDKSSDDEGNDDSDDETVYDADDELDLPQEKCPGSVPPRRMRLLRAFIAYVETLSDEEKQAMYTVLKALYKLRVFIRYQKRHPKPVEVVMEEWYAFYGREPAEEPMFPEMDEAEMNRLYDVMHGDGPAVYATRDEERPALDVASGHVKFGPLPEDPVDLDEYIDL